MQLAHTGVGEKAADSWKAHTELVAGAEPGREEGPGSTSSLRYQSGAPRGEGRECPS